MKRSYFLLILSFFSYLLSYAQPGPSFFNLNDGIGDIIIIDSTTNLARIALLKQQRNLHLIVMLPTFPVEFKDFVHTESLTIEAPTNCNTLDIYFPNLKHLNIRRFQKKTIADKKFAFPTLQSLYIMDSKNLEDIDAFANCINIEKIMIRNTPNLIQFPKFHRKNKVKELILDHGTTFRKNDTKNYLKPIKRLTKLKKLTLGNIYSVNEVPSYLPSSIEYLEINSWALHNHITRIKSLQHLKKYTNLKTLKLYKIALDPVQEKFPAVSLEYLFLTMVQGVKDISWIFTFKGIDHVELRNCNELTEIYADTNTDVISTLDIRAAANLTSIDALFRLNNLKYVYVRNCPNLVLPSTEIMYKTPNIMLSGTKYHLYKKDGVWEKIVYY